MTTTSSSRRILAPMLELLRRQRDDLHEVALAQLARDRPEDAGAARVVLRVDQHGGVLVEGDVGAVGAAKLLAGPHDDGLHHFALADAALRARLLDGRGDHVADPGVAPVRAALDADAEDLSRARVVRHPESCLLLDHPSAPTWPSRSLPAAASASSARAAVSR